MTRRADRIRAARRASAAPGGTRDRMIHLTSALLPGAVGAIAAVMIVLPLFPKSEVSFLLDRNRVAVVENRLTVNQAAYRGEDAQNRPFSVNAANAVQHSASVPIVHMDDLTANMQLTNGTAKAVAPTGDYHLDTDRMVVNGPVLMTTTTGYTLHTQGAVIDLKTHEATSTSPVTGVTPRGPFSADRVAANLETGALTLDGHAHLRMLPKQGK